jgi:hypothetical protein
MMLLVDRTPIYASLVCIPGPTCRVCIQLSKVSPQMRDQLMHIRSASSYSFDACAVCFSVTLQQSWNVLIPMYVHVTSSLNFCLKHLMDPGYMKDPLYKLEVWGRGVLI